MGSLHTSVWSSAPAPTWGASFGHVGHGACSRVEAASTFAGQMSLQEVFSHHQLSQILLQAHLQAYSDRFAELHYNLLRLIITIACGPLSTQLPVLSTHKTLATSSE